jgi:hypothetical protein
VLAGIAFTLAHLATCTLLFCAEYSGAQGALMTTAAFLLLPISSLLKTTGLTELLPWQLFWTIAFAHPPLWGFGLAALLDRLRKRRK